MDRPCFWRKQERIRNDISLVRSLSLPVSLTCNELSTEKGEIDHYRVQFKYMVVVPNQAHSSYVCD